MTPSAAQKVIGLVGAASVVAAGTAAGVLLRRRRSGADPEESKEPTLGTLRGERHTVTASDGLPLYAEVDEPTKEGAGSPVVVFVHGYGLNLDSWHFQRLGLRDEHRLVLFDQRSHGRSGRSRPEHCTIDQLGDDLGQVIDALAPHDPVVLVGHSMGGMTILALAQLHPEWFGERVAGIVLMSTCADGMEGVTFGLPRGVARVFVDASPSLLTAVAHAPRLAERGRRLGSRYAVAMTRRLAFGGPVPEEYVAFADAMISATPVEVLSHFYPEFARLDKSHVLAVGGWPPTTILVGDRDLLTPVDLSRRMAQALPHARLVEVPGAGHLVMIERSEAVNDEIVLLLKTVSRR